MRPGTGPVPGPGALPRPGADRRGRARKRPSLTAAGASRHRLAAAFPPLPGSPAVACLRAAASTFPVPSQERRGGAAWPAYGQFGNRGRAGGPFGRRAAAVNGPGRASAVPGRADRPVAVQVPPQAAQERGGAAVLAPDVPGQLISRTLPGSLTASRSSALKARIASPPSRAASACRHSRPSAPGCRYAAVMRMSVANGPPGHRFQYGCPAVAPGCRGGAPSRDDGHPPASHSSSGSKPPCSNS
jgi:hypothetical protein